MTDTDNQFKKLADFVFKDPDNGSFTFTLRLKAMFYPEDSDGPELTLLAVSLENYDLEYPDEYIEAIKEYHKEHTGQWGHRGIDGIYELEVRGTSSRDYEGDYDYWEEVLSVTRLFVCPICGGLVNDAEKKPTFNELMANHLSHAAFPNHFVCSSHFNTKNGGRESVAEMLIAKHLEKYTKPVEPNPDPIVQQIYLTGNNGGDYIHITQTQAQADDDTCSIEVGHCCVVMLRAIAPTVFFSALTAETMYGFNNEKFTTVREYVAGVLKIWGKEVTDKLLPKVRIVNFLGEVKEESTEPPTSS